MNIKNKHFNKYQEIYKKYNVLPIDKIIIYLDLTWVGHSSCNTVEEIHVEFTDDYIITFFWVKEYKWKALWIIDEELENITSYWLLYAIKYKIIVYSYNNVELCEFNKFDEKFVEYILNNDINKCKIIFFKDTVNYNNYTNSNEPDKIYTNKEKEILEDKRKEFEKKYEEYSVFNFSAGYCRGLLNASYTDEEDDELTKNLQEQAIKNVKKTNV